MEKLLNFIAKALGGITYSSAVAGAKLASHRGIYQIKTPKALIK